MPNGALALYRKAGKISLWRADNQRNIGPDRWGNGWVTQTKSHSTRHLWYASANALAQRSLMQSTKTSARVTSEVILEIIYQWFNTSIWIKYSQLTK